MRGGGECGSEWYRQGRRANKLNSFDDFIACAEHLIDVEQLSDPGRVAAHGMSAGGLLVAGAINMQPSLFKAAVLEVPFVDVLSCMDDDTLPLTTLEYDEWGDPSETATRELIASYDPYLNIPRDSEGAYPSLMVTASMSDARVPYWAPLKMVAKLRDHLRWGGGDGQVLILKTDMEHGHYGDADQSAQFDDDADELTFLLTEVN